MIRVAVVEDDSDLCEEIVFSLTDDGNDAVGFRDSAGLYRHLMKSTVDIVVLDVGLPGEDGFAIARHLRDSPSCRAVGIIMLTALSGLDHRVEGLESGADIYLVKSASIRELRAAIASLARRLKLSPEPSAGQVWRYSPSAWTLTSPSGAGVKLSGSEKAVVEFFLRHPCSVAKRRDLIEKALGGDYLSYDPRRLEAIVSRLRRKLEQISPLAQPLRAVHGVGYEFTSALERLD
ncbi:response regulator transcription factor [Candidatus Methylospira mobilis]|uniref:Response regulator transcription factor n=1 Tax=Candidatus Methylospira mobilis TaxID=1808979 RepID=A0A5Q0BE62_9GAMM|nr:response regulator transcription factor [Candidatus Methylospira mobilis]QFY42163.1 response regulator transcription factor [Candidatus Methylospira mobilis]WNV03177.1 response regulator transcription factor [Candidatus Methylospira mobilis]